MDWLAERWLGHKTIQFGEVAGSGKTFIGFARVSIKEATEYAAEDVDVTLRLWRALKPRLPAEGMTKVYETLERPLIVPLARMERRGIAIDRDILSRLSGEFAQGMARLEAEIQAIVGAPFNPGSPKQLGDILFGQMGLPGGKKTATGAWSTSAGVLEDLAAEGHQLPARILEWRQLSKLKSTYTDALPSFVNPHDKARAYVLRAGGDDDRAAVFVRPQPAEHSGAQRRRAQNPPRLRRDAGPCADLGRLQPDRIAPARPYRRHRAVEKGFRRRARHSCDDGVGNVRRAGQGHARRSAPPRQGDQFRHHLRHFRFRPRQPARHSARRGRAPISANISSAFPASATIWTRPRRRARADGFVRTIFGRKCHFPRINASNPSERAFNERAAINAPIQGSAADIIRRAMIRMDDALAAAKLDALMLLQVHDELVFEAPLDQVEATIKLVSQSDGRRAASGAATERAAAGRRAGGGELGRGALRGVGAQPCRPQSSQEATETVAVPVERRDAIVRMAVIPRAKRNNGSHSNRFALDEFRQFPSRHCERSEAIQRS